MLRPPVALFTDFVPVGLFFVSTVGANPCLPASLMVGLPASLMVGLPASLIAGHCLIHCLVKHHAKRNLSKK